MPDAKSSPLRIVTLLIRCALALLFTYSGAVKLLGIVQFADHVGDFGIVADSLVPATAWAIIVAEIVMGLGLLGRSRICLAGIAALLVAYSLTLTYGIALGLDVECGCLGSDYRLAMPMQLMIDLGLLLLVIFLAIFDSGVKNDSGDKRAWFGVCAVLDRGHNDDARRMRDESVSAGSADRRVGD